MLARYIKNSVAIIFFQIKHIKPTYGISWSKDAVMFIMFCIIIGIFDQMKDIETFYNGLPKSTKISKSLIGILK